MTGYPSDTSALTLDEFCFRSNSRKYTPDVKGKGRDVIDAFRTVYWFHGLRIQLGDSARNLHAMERRLEPRAFNISRDGVPYRRNKWWAYRVGLHTPVDSLVADVDTRGEGSRMQFAHVLWDTLRLQHPVSQFANDWIQRLEPSVQILLWTPPKQQTKHVRTRRRRIDRRTLDVLERRAGLDALACLTLLLREAYEAGNSEYAYELGFRVCRMLLLVSIDLYAHGIANALYEFYDQAILPLGVHQGLYRTYRSIHFLALMGRVSNALYHLKGVEVWKLSAKETRHYKQKILGRDYGWDLFYLFQPNEVPVDAQLIASDAYRLFWEAQCDLRGWVWEAIYRPIAQRRPPAKLWQAERHARQAFQNYLLSHQA